MSGRGVLRSLRGGAEGPAGRGRSPCRSRRGGIAGVADHVGRGEPSEAALPPGDGALDLGAGLLAPRRLRSRLRRLRTRTRRGRRSDPRRKPGRTPHARASASGICQKPFFQRTVQSRPTTRVSISANNASRRTMRVARVGGRDREALVPERDPALFQEPVRPVERRDPGHAHLLDSRSCAVPNVRSTRPFACGEPAKISSTPSFSMPRRMTDFVRLPSLVRWPKCPAWSA